MVSLIRNTLKLIISFLCLSQLAIGMDINTNPNRLTNLIPDFPNKKFYHWDGDIRTGELLLDGKINWVNFRNYVFITMGMAEGAGLYMAEYPTSSMNYGENVTEISCPKDLLAGMEERKECYCYTNKNQRESWWVLKINRIIDVNNDLKKDDQNHGLFSGGLGGFIGHVAGSLGATGADLLKTLNPLQILALKKKVR